jgi:hypothetical protein
LEEEKLRNNISTLKYLEGRRMAETYRECQSIWKKIKHENGDVTMSDKSTGKMWTGIANLGGRKRWDDALTFCKSLTYAGYSDWRLPNKTELRAQFQHQREFSGVERGGNLYWSGTLCGYIPGFAWYVDMNTGNVSTLSKSWDLFVWPVRGKQ